MENTKFLYGEVFLEAEDLKERSAKNPIELMYYKTRQSRKNLTNQPYEIFGVEIIKKEYIGKEIQIESRSIENISRNEQTINKVMELLKNNTVTPVSLEDVIGDILH